MVIIWFGNKFSVEEVFQIELDWDFSVRLKSINWNMKLVSNLPGISNISNSNYEFLYILK